jgi:hypothetical protein
MTLANDINTLMARRRNELIQKAVEASKRGDRVTKADVEMRLRFIKELRESLGIPSQLSGQTVFISYSHRTGRRFYEITKAIAKEHGFDVVTGFDRQRNENVLRTVMDLIRASAVFLSIMTPEYEIRQANGAEARAAPSVWLMEEKGMALAFGKPFRLLVEQSVHEDFWRRTTPDKLHTEFEPVDFEAKAREAVEALTARYEELTLSLLHEETRLTPSIE